jgi:hypothetical protein
MNQAGAEWAVCYVAIPCRLLSGKPDGARGDILRWSWDFTLGREDPDTGDVLLETDQPPKAGLCTVLFNPIYKFIFIKNTKVAGTSVFLNFGGECMEPPTLETAKVSARVQRNDEKGNRRCKQALSAHC